MRPPLAYRRDVVDREAARLAAVLAGLDPATPVPTCPGWTARDLLAHVTQVHDFWAHVVGERLDEAGVHAFVADRPEPPTAVPDLLAARADATARLLAALDARDPVDPAWSWFPPEQTVGFTWRMQTHEATIHRVDAELAAGLPVTPIDAEVAGEGVDHCLDVMWAWVPSVAPARGGAVELVATDAPRTWLVQPCTVTGDVLGRPLVDHPGARRAAPGARPVARVRGTVQALDLFCWNRGGDVEATGDDVALAALRAATGTGIG